MGTVWEPLWLGFSKESRWLGFGLVRRWVHRSLGRRSVLPKLAKARADQLMGFALAQLMAPQKLGKEKARP